MTLSGEPAPNKSLNGELSMTKNLIAFLLLGAAVALPTNVAQGQDRRPDPALLLARICVSEAGWDCFNTKDGYAIHEVLLRGAARHSISYTAFARSYSKAAGRGGENVRPRIRWIREMNERGDQPASWPMQRYVTRRDGSVSVHPGLPWSQYRGSWLAVLERAREVVGRYALDNLTVWGVCPTPIHDWGGDMDHERATRIGLIQVTCNGGETSNNFYARPALLSAR